MQKQIVALVGPLGAGKDTIAKYLVEYHGFRRFAFADEIKKEYYVSSKYDEEQFKAARGTPLEEIIRMELWLYSDGIKREKGPLYFINVVVNAIQDCQHSVIVTDVRTPEELDAMRSIGAKIVLVLKTDHILNWFSIDCESRNTLLIPGTRLIYNDIKSNDNLFLNYECGDLEQTNHRIDNFCRKIGILEGDTMEAQSDNVAKNPNSR